VHCGPPGQNGQNGQKQKRINSRLISSPMDNGGFGFGAVVVTSLLAGLALALRRRFRLSR
jgi:hypothetical protein